MPDVDQNRAQWDGSYDWPQAGDEWSAPWGGTITQWRATLLPRLQSFLPAESILEIAPGYGRWTPFLLEACKRYVGVDIAAGGIEACRRRFADAPHAEFHVNDGRSLDVVEDGSVDLAFSFDSLVHVEDDVIGAYLAELSAKLTDHGLIFLHHSNLAACPPLGWPLRMGLRAVGKLRRRPHPGWDYWRGTSMSADRFRALAEAAGLVCVGQETINWLGSRPIDCISLATRPGSTWDRPTVTVNNPFFMAEAASAFRVSQVYSRYGSNPPDPADSGQTNRRQYFGPHGVLITNRTVGPWSFSVVGPWPRRRFR